MTKAVEQIETRPVSADAMYFDGSNAQKIAQFLSTTSYSERYYPSGELKEALFSGLPKPAGYYSDLVVTPGCWVVLTYNNEATRRINQAGKVQVFETWEQLQTFYRKR